MIQTADATDSVPGESLVRSLDYFHLFYLFLPSVELLITILLLPSLPHVRVQAAICSADLSEQEVAAAWLRHTQTTTCFAHFPSLPENLCDQDSDQKAGDQSGGAALKTPLVPVLLLLLYEGRGKGKGGEGEKEKKKEKKNPFLLGRNFIKCERRERTLHKPLM